MLCYGCGKQRNELHPIKSNIMKGMQLFMCQICIELKHEPRWIIVLGSRQNGPDSVREYIIKHLYTGRHITGEELIA